VLIVRPARASRRIRGPRLTDGRRVARVNPHPTEDRYLSARTLREAAGVLEGLATLLDRVDGVFADDAAGDAAHLRDLAATLTEWSPHPAPRPGAPVGPPVAPQAWAELLTVYVSHGLRP
jgi:hypothetical protein